MHTYRAAKAPLALSATAVLLLTACNGDEGLGDSGALSGVEVNHTSEGEAPEVVIYDPIEADENSSYVVTQGDGEQVGSDMLVDYHMTAVNPDDGAVQQHSYDEMLPQTLPVPLLLQSDNDLDRFVGEAVSGEGATVGSDVLLYMVADEEIGMTEPILWNVEILDQYLIYADGQEQEQSGDLPQIDSETGTAPELGEYDAEAEPPSELTSEVLIAGEGAEVADDDHVIAQYRGWRWEDGEIFDQSWSEDGEPGAPFDFSLTGGVIEGWLEGIPGHNVGDRLLLVIPEDQAYGEAVNDDGTTETGGPGGTLIFAIDILRTIDSETMEELQAAQQEAQQPEMGEMPEVDEEEVAELADELGVGEDEIAQFLMMGISPDELREMFQGAEDGAEDEADSEEDPGSDDDTDDEDE